MLEAEEEGEQMVGVEEGGEILQLHKMKVEEVPMRY